MFLAIYANGLISRRECRDRREAVNMLMTLHEHGTTAIWWAEADTSVELEKRIAAGEWETYSRKHIIGDVVGIRGGLRAHTREHRSVHDN